MSFNVRNPIIESLLRRIGRYIGDQLPRNWGFTVLIFNFGENRDESDGMFYISNAERGTMIEAMKEFIKKNEH